MTKLFRIFYSDTKIIEAIKEDNDTALSYLYETNLRMITKYVTENNGSGHEAEEMLQDALVVLWEKVRKKEFQLNSKISTYLYAVVKNKWLQELSRRKRFTDLEEANQNPCKEKSVAEQIDENEMTQIVKKAMAQLSPLCKKILTLYYYEEKSMDEIRILTNLANENVAKSKKYQCKKELELLVKSALKE